VKISLGLPTHRVDRPSEFLVAESVMDIARAAESAGFGGVFVTEHPIPARGWLETGGHHALDPFVALSFAGAATTAIGLQTHLCVLPYRNPFLAAKAVASLDVLSGGRAVLGVGTGYLEPEFAALGVDFSERNDLTDESIMTMKAVWSGQPVSVVGRHFNAQDCVALPRPTQRPHPPIWVGGNSRRAVRRAVELADGWAPMPNAAQSVGRRHTPALESLQTLKLRIEDAREYAASIGRSDPLAVAWSLDGMANEGGTDEERIELAGQLGEIGVTHLYSNVPHTVSSRTEFLDEVARRGERLVPSIAAITAQCG
jgi:probable F420-dependent oxidoreductase